MDGTAFLHRLLEGCAPAAVRSIRDGYHALERLPYRRIWVLDSEFATNGNPHRTWCFCGLELRTGCRFELWTDGYQGPPPCLTDRDTLFVAFVASAEIACWQQLGWPTPERVLDLYQEARIVTNTGLKSDPHSLADACRYQGIGMLDLDLKKAHQMEAQNRTIWPTDEREKLLAYCSSDVTATAQLLLATLPGILKLYGDDVERGLYFTMMRGECSAAMGKAELRGLPVNPDEWAVLRGGRLGIFPAMVAGLPPELRAIYRNTRGGPVFNTDAFEAEMARRGLSADWPRTPLSNRLNTSREMLKQMLGPVPELHPLAEVMGSQATIALLQWKVGQDGCCRTLISPGRTATGRCAPRGREFPFAAPRRFRHALQAPPGSVILQADYAGQESGILAEQSGDAAYLAAYETGDIHMAAAKLCKIVPESATDITHPKERGQLKAVNHGLAYGSRPKRVAAQLGVDLATAEYLYSTHRRVFHRVHDYLAAAVDTADNDRRSTCQDGWSKRIVPPFSATTALNFGVQATGAAILRRAIVLVDRAGLPLVATVHDSLIFVCLLQDAAAVLLEAERLMVDAAAYFCPGITLRVDFSASVPVPGMPSDRKLKPLADPRSRESYDQVLEQARTAGKAT